MDHSRSNSTQALSLVSGTHRTELTLSTFKRVGGWETFFYGIEEGTQLGFRPTRAVSHKRRGNIYGQRRRQKLHRYLSSPLSATQLHHRARGDPGRADARAGSAPALHNRGEGRRLDADDPESRPRAATD